MEKIDTTTETIIGQSFQVKWYQPCSKYWAITYLGTGLICGRGTTREYALACLVGYIERNHGSIHHNGNHQGKPV